jgi:hypothetical protein
MLTRTRSKLERAALSVLQTLLGLSTGGQWAKKGGLQSITPASQSTEASAGLELGTAAKQRAYGICYHRHIKEPITDGISFLSCVLNKVLIQGQVCSLVSSLRAQVSCWVLAQKKGTHLHASEGAVIPFDLLLPVGGSDNLSS